MPSHLLTVDQLTCAREQKILFADLSFTLKNRDVLLVEGDNGSGKSSLLKLLSGLNTPQAGSISWNNQLIENNAVEFSQQLHYIGHTNGIKLGLTVLENLRLMQQLYQDDAQIKRANNDTTFNQATLHDDITHAHHAAEKLNFVMLLLQLDTIQDKIAKNLSAGQKRRVALAKLFLFPRPLWILDEPLTALDASLQTLLITTVEKHVVQGGIAVVSSHHPIEFNVVDTQILRLSS